MLSETFKQAVGLTGVPWLITLCLGNLPTNWFAMVWQVILTFSSLSWHAIALMLLDLEGSKMIFNFLYSVVCVMINRTEQLRSFKSLVFYCSYNWKERTEPEEVPICEFTFVQKIKSCNARVYTKGWILTPGQNKSFNKKAFNVAWLIFKIFSFALFIHWN